MKSFKKSYPKTAKWMGRAGSAIKLASSAYRIATTVASIINPEKKYFDTVISVQPDSTASITHLTAVPQGDTNGTRNGNSIAIKSFEIDYIVSHNTANPDELTRVIIFEDLDNNSGTPPTATQLLETPSDVTSFRNMDYPKRFKVYSDRLHKHIASTTVWDRFKMFKPFFTQKDSRGLKVRNHHITWTGTAGGDEARGHIYMCVFGNVATASTTSTIVGTSRIRFYDN